MTTVVYADGPGCPVLSPAAALEVAEVVGRPEVLFGWTPTPPPWIDDPELVGESVMPGYGLSSAVRDGRIRPLSVPLGAVPDLLRARRPTVGVVPGVPRGSGYGFGTSVGWADVLARIADRVVVEVDPSRPDLGGPAITGNIVATVPRAGTAAVTNAQRTADAVDVAIAERVASLIPRDATLELGVGATADAIAACLDRPVTLWTGLLTDTAAELYDRGLVVGRVTTAYTWGGEAARRLHADGLIDVTSTTVTHDVARLATIPRFIACNGALQVGLDGSVNLERIGRRHISGIGGHRDFSAGARRSIGGASVVVVRSTTANGDSSIVPNVDVVSTPSELVDLVVSEHGVADLRGAIGIGRATQLVAVAAPQHREALRRALSH